MDAPGVPCGSTLQHRMRGERERERDREREREREGWDEGKVGRRAASTPLNFNNQNSKLLMRYDLIILDTPHRCTPSTQKRAASNSIGNTNIISDSCRDRNGRHDGICRSMTRGKTC
jgi:hypothetical protein